MVFPLFWLVSTSLRPAPELLLVPPRLLPMEWTLANYAKAFAVGADAALPVEQLRVRDGVHGLHPAHLDAWPATSSRKFKFPGNNILFILVLATAIVPFEIYMVPLFLQVNALKLVNTRSGCSCPSWSLSTGSSSCARTRSPASPTSSSMRPGSTGCRSAAIMIRFVPRLLAPAIAALAILAFIQAWTAFIWPLLDPQRPEALPDGAGPVAVREHAVVDFGVTSAGAVIAMLPTLIAFLFLRRRIVEGITLTGLKG